MTRVSTLDVKTDGSLKVKRCTLVITNCEASSNSKDKIKDKEQASSNYVTIGQAEGLEVEVEPAKPPKSIEDGGQAMLMS